MAGIPNEELAREIDKARRKELILALHPERCPICFWPWAESADKGCVPDNCSFRPDAIGDRVRTSERRGELESILTKVFPIIERAVRQRDDQWKLALGYIPDAKHTYSDDKLYEAVIHAPYVNDAKIAVKDRLQGEIERAVQAEREDARAYHHVMSLLRNTKMEHGLCQPRERRACTHCNAIEELDKLLKDYKGARIVASARSQDQRSPEAK